MNNVNEEIQQLPAGDSDKSRIENMEDTNVPNEMNVVTQSLLKEENSSSIEIVEIGKGRLLRKPFYHGKELYNLKVMKIPTLVDPIIPKYGIAGLIGSSDLGKSTFLLQLCTDLVLNDSFLGFNITSTYKKAIYVSTEDDEFTISQRIQRLEGYDEEKFDNIRFIFDTTSLVQKLEGMLKEEPVDIVVVDTLSDIYQGEMNQINQIRTFLTEFNNLAERYKCLMFFNHHTGKNAESREPNKSNSVGSVGFEGKCRLMIELRADFSDNDVRHLCIVKGNYLGPEYKNRSYELSFNQVSGFSFTGNRADFNSLIRPKLYQQPVNRDVEKGIAIELKKEGKSVRAIAEYLKGLGYKVGKTGVSEWTKGVKADNNTSEVLEELDGEEMKADGQTEEASEGVLELAGSETCPSDNLS